MKKLSIGQLRKDLEEIIGSDLADSLLTAATGNADSSVNKLILKADGLEDLTEEQHKKLIALLDRFSDYL